MSRVLTTLLLLKAGYLFFLGSLEKQVQVLDRKLEGEKDLLVLPKLSQDILVAAREHGRVTVRDIQRLTAANRNTIKARPQAPRPPPPTAPRGPTQGDLVSAVA